MAFIARMSWVKPEHLDEAVVRCIREHSVLRSDPAVQESQGASVACVAPSRIARFPTGTLVALSGRPTLPHARADEVDIEAVYRLYKNYGAEMAERISGSFGVAILDPACKRVLFVRDKIGFVPLFFARDPTGIWVSDSLKPILASKYTYFTLDHEAIYRYIYLKAFESPDTVVNEIKSVRPGTLFDTTPSGLAEKVYWDLPLAQVRKDAGGSAIELAELLTGAVDRSIGLSKGPTGVMVSGGLDSGVLSCLSAKLRASGNIGINVTFESKWRDIDESLFAQAVADACGLELTKLEFTEERLARALPMLWWNNPLPTANSGFKLNLVGQDIDAIGRPDTFMLGEGADTLLSSGWDWKHFERIHRVAHLTEMLPNDLRQDASSAMESFLRGIQTSRFRNNVTGILRSYVAASLGHLKWKGSVIRPEAIDKLFAPSLRDQLGQRLLSRVFTGYFDNVKAPGFSERLIYATFKSYVPNQQLINYQSACNYFGAELACPFLDERVVDFCLKLPWPSREGKRILKEVAEQSLPTELVNREKCAFLMPMTEWINTRFRSLVDLVFSRAVIEQRGLFDPTEMASLKQAFETGRFCSWSDIWTFVVLEAWLRINLDAELPICPNSIETVFPELEDKRFL